MYISNFTLRRKLSFVPRACADPEISIVLVRSFDITYDDEFWKYTFENVYRMLEKLNLCFCIFVFSNIFKNYGSYNTVFKNISCRAISKLNK